MSGEYYGGKMDQQLRHLRGKLLLMAVVIKWCFLYGRKSEMQNAGCS
jgi:hypothetical protein